MSRKRTNLHNYKVESWNVSALDDTATSSFESVVMILRVPWSYAWAIKVFARRESFPRVLCGK